MVKVPNFSRKYIFNRLKLITVIVSFFEQSFKGNHLIYWQLKLTSITGIQDFSPSHFSPRDFSLETSTSSFLFVVFGLVVIMCTQSAFIAIMAWNWTKGAMEAD